MNFFNDRTSLSMAGAHPNIYKSHKVLLCYQRSGTNTNVIFNSESDEILTN